MFLLRVHSNILEDGKITFATLARDHDKIMFLYIWLMAFCILNIQDIATYAIAIRQWSSSKLQETQGHMDIYDKPKWIHRITFLREMCGIAWFIVQYNMIYQYLAYLTRQLDDKKWKHTQGNNR